MGLLETILIGAGLAGIGLAGYGMGYEARQLHLTRVLIRSGDWPAGAPTVQIAILSDFHAGGPGDHPGRIDRAVTLANAEEPDLVLLLGDFLHIGAQPRRGASPELVAAEVARLRAPDGVFAVLGNHDRTHGLERVAAALTAAGITVLSNQAKRTSVKGQPVWLAGVADAYNRLDDLGATLAPIDDQAPVILLTHSPDLFPVVPKGIAIAVAGHTHGGQVRLPWLGAPWCAPWIPGRAAKRYPAGHIVERGRQFFVTTGIGHSGLALRLNAPPEVVLMRLTST